MYVQVYERKQKVRPDDMELTMGRMRCHHAMAEWEELTKLAEDIWPKADKSIRQAIAPLAAGAAWNLRLWKNMEEYIAVMSENTVRFSFVIYVCKRRFTERALQTNIQVDGTFFKAILNLHKENYEEAHKYINRTRELLDTELRALVRLSQLVVVFAFLLVTNNPIWE